MQNFQPPHTNYAQQDLKPSQWGPPATPTPASPTHTQPPHAKQLYYNDSQRKTDQEKWWGWNNPEPTHIAGKEYAPHAGRIVRQLLTTDTVPKAISGLIDLLRPPDLIDIGKKAVTLGKSDAPIFSETQRALGKTVGEFAFLTTRNQFDIGDHSAYFTDEGQKKNLPALAQASAEIEKISPVTFRKGYQGTYELAKHIQEEPGELALDLALSTTGFGIAGSAIRQAARITRRARSAFDPLSDLPTALDNINVLTGKVDPHNQLLKSTVQLDVFGDRQLNPFKQGFGRREYQGTGTGFATDGRIVTAAHTLIGSHEGAITPRLIRATTVTGQKANLNPATATFRTEADLAALNKPNLQGLQSIDIDTGILETVTGIDRQTAAVSQQILRQGEAALQATKYRSVEGASGMGLLSQRGTIGGVYLGEIGEQGIITPGETIRTFLNNNTNQTLQGTGVEALRQQLISEGLHYQAARNLEAAQRRPDIFKLHSKIGTGEIDAPHVFKFFDPQERDEILKGGRLEPKHFSTRDAILLLKDRYPQAETVQQMLFRGTHHTDIHFRAQPPGEPLISHHSYDLSLTNYAQRMLEAGMPRQRLINEIREKAPDAYLSGKQVNRKGVFATSSYDQVERYLKGFTAKMHDETITTEGGTQLNVFTAERFPFNEHLFGDEFVVKPKEELYRINKDLLQLPGEGYHFDGQFYPAQWTEPSVRDAPAELFANKPRRRFLTERREYGNLRLHSSRRKELRFIREPGKFWDDANKPSLAELQQIGEAPLDATQTGTYWSLKGIYSGRDTPDQQIYHHNIDEKLTIPISQMSEHNIWARTQDSFGQATPTWEKVDRDFIANQVRRKRFIDRSHTFSPYWKNIYEQSDKFAERRSQLANTIRTIRKETPRTTQDYRTRISNEYYSFNTETQNAIANLKNEAASKIGIGDWTELNNLFHEYFIEDTPLRLHSGRVRNIFRKLDAGFNKGFNKFEDFAFPTLIKWINAVESIPNRIRRTFREDTIQDIIDDGSKAKNTFFRVQPKGASVVGHRPVDYALSAALQDATRKTDPDKRRSIITALPEDALIETDTTGSWDKFTEYVTRGGLYAGRNEKLPLKYLDPSNTNNVGGNELVIFKGEELPRSYLQGAHEAIVKPSQVLYRIPVDELPTKRPDDYDPFLNNWIEEVPDFNTPAKNYSIDPTLPLHLHSSQQHRDIFGLSQRLVSHHTDHYNYGTILEEGRLLPSRASGESSNMYALDRHAGDDQYIFLGKYTGTSTYGDHGLIFSAEQLIHNYKAVVGERDLFSLYSGLADDLETTYIREGKLKSSIYANEVRDNAFKIPTFRQAFQQQAQLAQRLTRFTGEAAIATFDQRPFMEMLVPDQLPISEAVGVVKDDISMLITPETRGPDPDRWKFKDFPNQTARKQFNEQLQVGIKSADEAEQRITLRLHGRRGRPPSGKRTLYHATPAWNIESIIQHGLDPTRARGKRKETYLHTPARREWAIQHTMENHGITREQVAIFETEVKRRNLTRRWRGIWSTPEHIKDPRLLKLHSKRRTLDPESFFSWNTLNERLNPTVTLYKDIPPKQPDINELMDDAAYEPTFEDLDQYNQLHFFDEPATQPSAPSRPLALPPPDPYPPTPSQARAMQHTFGPAVVFAGPGSGKTQTLIGRMKSLRERGIAGPDDILTLVFGKEAAVDMQRRAGDAWNISTIHAFARKIVRENYETLGYKTAPEIDPQTFEQWLPKQSKLFGHPITPQMAAQWGQQYEKVRSNFLTGKENYTTLPKNIQDAISKFRQQKYTENRFDFTDAILQASYILEQNPGIRQNLQTRFPFIQIDEFQDVSPLQNRLLRNLSQNQWAVGDLDQSIMSFTGGSGEVMRDFIRQGAALYNIEENFRSTPEVIAAAQKFIQRDKERIDVQQAPVRPSGTPVNIVPSSDNQARDLLLLTRQMQRGRETAILTRTIRERDTYQKRIGKILRGQGWTDAELAKVYYSTAHAAKGKEWQDVIVPLNLLDKKRGEKDRTFPTRHAATKAELAEEERLFYVALTRAEDNLTIIGRETHPYMQPFTNAQNRQPTYFEDATTNFAYPQPTPAPATPAQATPPVPTITPQTENTPRFTGLRTILASPQNILDYIIGGEKRLARLKKEREALFGNDPTKKVKLHSGQRSLYSPMDAPYYQYNTDNRYLIPLILTNPKEQESDEFQSFQIETYDNRISTPNEPAQNQTNRFVEEQDDIGELTDKILNEIDSRGRTLY